MSTTIEYVTEEQYNATVKALTDDTEWQEAARANHIALRTTPAQPYTGPREGMWRTVPLPFTVRKYKKATYKALSRHVRNALLPCL